MALTQICLLQTTYQTSHGQLLDLITAPIGTVCPKPCAILQTLSSSNGCRHSLRGCLKVPGFAAGDLLLSGVHFSNKFCCGDSHFFP